jgi:hypothetical protein
MNYFICLVFLFASPLVFAEKIVLSSVPRVEMLLGIGTMYDSVQIQVESNGCTTNESFYVQRYMNPDDELIHLKFIRVRPDWCKAYLPEGTWLQFMKTDLEISSKDIIMIDNPFGPNLKLKD